MPAKRNRKSATVERLLEEAQDQGRCAVASDRSEAMALLRARDAGRIISPMPRLYVDEQDWTTKKPGEKALHVVRALWVLHPDWVFAGPTAALVLGLSVSYEQIWPLRVAAKRDSTRYSGPYVISQQADFNDSICVQGVNVTSAARTAFDCLREMSFPDGLAVADSLLRRCSISRDRLLERLDEFSHNTPGWRHALETAALADPRAESGGESIARARMVLLGYERPELQVPMENSIDGGTYRADFGWSRGGGRWLLGELDGAEKYERPEMTRGAAPTEVLRVERLRESRLGAHDVSVMRFSFEEMMGDRRFKKILDAYGVPKATSPVYLGVGEAFEPVGVARCRKELRRIEQTSGGDLLR